jgi:ribonucleotide reductase beta subunit family protein with ferritin-like domain
MVALSFGQRNLLRNFGSLMDWVVRDESLHLKFGINFILTLCSRRTRTCRPRSWPQRSSAVPKRGASA